MHQLENAQKYTSNKPLEIVIVDNDPISCKIQQMKVSSRFSLPISVYEDAQDALDYISNAEGSDFLVLLDIDMPSMDGWEFLSEWSRTRSKSKIFVIMLSCSISSKDKEKSRTFPEVVDYYEKPLYDSHLNSISEFLSSLPNRN